MDKWAEIPGYEGLYAVSDQGEVWSLHRTDRRGALHAAQRISFNYRHKGGYIGVTLAKDGWKQFYLVHSLVLKAFIGQAPAGCEALHGPNPDRRDNRLVNLRWGTRSENQADRNEQGTSQRGEGNHQCKIPTFAVECIRNDNRSQRCIGRAWGISQQQVSKIKRNQRRAYS